MNASQPPPIETHARDYPRGGGVARHAHAFGQVAFARRGVMRVVTEAEGGQARSGQARSGRARSGQARSGQALSGQGGVWLVPPGRALWIPARVPHEVQCRTDVAMRTVYLRADSRLPYRDDLAVLAVTPLLREVILRLVEGPDDPGTRAHLVALLEAEMRAARTVPLNLPQPRDARLARVVARLGADPAARGRLEDWADVAGMARRSFARRFAAETGLSFGAWRRRLRMLRAIERLAAGEPVTAVALETGYDSTSAFIHAFRKELGVTPGRYFGA